MKKHPTLLAGALLIALCSAASASTFVQILADNSSIDSTGSNLIDNPTGNTYRVIYKPSSTSSWINWPWIDTTQAWTGASAIGLEIDPSTDPTTPLVDKVNVRISSGNDSFALTNGVTRYTGFAVMLPSATNDIPTDRYLFAQWWQGSPYAPPVMLDVIPNTNPIQYHVLIHNTDTLGNPSAVPITLPVAGGNLSFDTWHTFVVMITPDYYGYNGQLQLWEDGQQLVSWTGKIGYDPSTQPYANATSSTPYPNQNMDVFFGPYRNRQNTTQQLFFDDVKFTDTYDEAVP